MILTAIVVLYTLFISLRPVEVVAVYHDNNYVDVIVKHFPSSDMDKITWWLDHKKHYPVKELFLHHLLYITTPLLSGIMDRALNQKMMMRFALQK